jgi:hypothetical protein
VPTIKVESRYVLPTPTARARESIKRGQTIRVIREGDTDYAIIAMPEPGEMNAIALIDAEIGEVFIYAPHPGYVRRVPSEDVYVVGNE